MDDTMIIQILSASFSRKSVIPLHFAYVNSQKKKWVRYLYFQCCQQCLWISLCLL